MNGDMKKYVYIMITVFVLFFAVKIFIKALPVLLAIGVTVYAVTKIVKFIKGKSEERNLNNSENSKADDYTYNASSDDYTNGEIIDVEYEDVDNRKN